jgi:hypothetical protein
MNSIKMVDFDAEELRTRLRKITDEELLRSGKAGFYICSPEANFGKPPLEVFVVQLTECRAEWSRRRTANELATFFRPSLLIYPFWRRP